MIFHSYVSLPEGNDIHDIHAKFTRLVRLTGLGPKSNVDANRMIFNFFAQHPLPRYIDINANLQLDAVHEVDKVDKVDTDTSSSIFPVVLLSFAIVASIMLALVVFKMVSVRSYSPLGNPSGELLVD